MKGQGRAASHAHEATEVASAGTPGKATLIDRFAAGAREAEAERCDQDQSGCFLPERDRERVRDQLRANALGAAQKWAQALVDARIVRLCQHESGWNALWEIGFYLAMGAAGRAIGTGMALLGGAARSMAAIRIAGPLVNHTKDVEHALLFAMKGFRIPLRVAVNAAANSGNAGAATFLEALREMPVDWALNLIEASADLDDYALLLLVESIDPRTNLTVEHFANQIELLLARWTRQVAAIGSRGERDGEIESCAWIIPGDGGTPRLARVRRATLDGTAPLVATTFVDWVEPDMVPMAIAQWEHTAPGQGIERVTLDQLADVPSYARSWEETATFPAAGPDDDDKPVRAFSHEDKHP